MSSKERKVRLHRSLGHVVEAGEGSNSTLSLSSYWMRETNPRAYILGGQGVDYNVINAFTCGRIKMSMVRAHIHRTDGKQLQCTILTTPNWKFFDLNF